jgi:hypothetical protein
MARRTSRRREIANGASKHVALRITDNGNFETVFRVLNRLARPLEKLAAGAEYRSPERGRPRESKEPGVYDWTLTMCGF